MRPVEFQPAVVQAPNAERVQQQQQAQPQISQQAFAGQMEKISEDRAHKVRETGPGQETRPPEDLSEEKPGQQRRRNRRRHSAPLPDEKASGKDDSVPREPGSKVDVRV